MAVTFGVLCPRCGVLAGVVLCLRWQQQATTATSGEGPLPFMEAWDSSFFFASDLLLLTTLAFVVNLVPTLDLHFAVSHCDSTILLNQAPRPKGSTGAVC